jgi:YcxB-like protein
MDDSSPVVLEVRASYADWREAADAPYQDGGPLPPDGWLGRVLGRRPFGIGGTATVTISERGIVIRQGLSSVEHPWSSFTEHFETARLLVVKSPPMTYVLLPKRALSGSDLDRARTLVARHLPARSP